jgi:hypothetical protein
MKIYADALRPGDVVRVRRAPRRIARVERRDGWAWPVATEGIRASPFLDEPGGCNGNTP